MAKTLDLILNEELARANQIVDFAASQFLQNSLVTLKPRMHQIVRIYESAQDGNKRILCADTTSAGKTLTAIAIKGLLDKKTKEKLGRKAKSLLIAPNQAISFAWTEPEISLYTKNLQLEPQNVAVLERRSLEDTEKFNKADILCVNYDKLSIPEDANDYMAFLKDRLGSFDMVIVDECHNLKNIQSNRSQAFNHIVNGTLGKHFVMLSATPIPNRLDNAGFLLYMLDPVKYKRYATTPFDYAKDQFAIMNAMNSGKWFSFGRDDLQQAFSLPNLQLGDSRLCMSEKEHYDLREEDIEKYFKVWQRDDFAGQKIVELSRILLKSSFRPLREIIHRIKEDNARAQIGIFSYYREGFSNELSNELAALLGDSYKIGVIHGGVPLEERLRRAQLFRKGEIDISINTLSTVSESISLSTGTRPVYVIFAEPPIVPANYDQAIGRFYRYGQMAPVSVIELIPESDKLNKLMLQEKQRRESQGVKFRKSWKPRNIFEDKIDIRQAKQEAIEHVSKGVPIGSLIEAMNVSEDSVDPSSHSSILCPAVAINITFNEGLKKVRGCIGNGKLFSSKNREALIESYALDKWDITSSADTNEAIAQVIHEIEFITGRNLERILDWGSGPACLARKLRRKVVNLDAMQEMLDNGIAATCDIYPEKEVEKYFIRGFAQKMPFPDRSFDLVVSSYALQYNAQGYQHKNDIAKILLETNRVLDSGYGIFALPNQVTEKEDIETLSERLLPLFGFKTLQYAYVTGHSVDERTNKIKKVFQGFHLLLYQKAEDITSTADTGSLFLFRPYKTLGIGGERELELEKEESVKYKKETIPATRFMTQDGKEFSYVLREALGVKA